MGGSQSLPEVVVQRHESQVIESDVLQTVNEFLPIFKEEWEKVYKSMKNKPLSSMDAKSLSSMTQKSANKKGNIDSKINSIVKNSENVKIQLIKQLNEALAAKPKQYKNVSEQTKIAHVETFIMSIAKTCLNHALDFESAKLLQPKINALLNGLISDSSSSHHHHSNSVSSGSGGGGNSVGTLSSLPLQITTSISRDSRQSSTSSSISNSPLNFTSANFTPGVIVDWGYLSHEEKSTQIIPPPSGNDKPEKDIPTISILNVLEFGPSVTEFLKRSFDKVKQNVFRLDIIGTEHHPYVFITGNNALHKFYHDHAHITRSKPFDSLKAVIGGGSIDVTPFLDGEPHLKRKKMLIDVCNQERLQKLLIPLNAIYTDYMFRWTQYQDFKMLNRAKDMCVDIAFKIIFGLDPVYVEAHHTYLKQMWDDFNGGATPTIPIEIPGSSFAKAIAARDALTSLAKESYSYFNTLTLEKKTDRLRQSSFAYFLYEVNLSVPLNDKMGPDAFAREILHVTFASGGFAVNFTSLVYYIATQPEYVKYMIEESSHLADFVAHPESNITLQELATSKLQYTEAFIYESMRNTGFPVMVGKTIKPWSVEGYNVPPGSHIIACLANTNHDENVYPKSKKFDPFRFLSPREEPKKAAFPTCAFAAQGAGDARTTHRCAGEQLVHVILRMFVIRLIHGFQYTLAHHQNLEMSGDAIPTFKSKLLIENFRSKDVGENGHNPLAITAATSSSASNNGRGSLSAGSGNGNGNNNGIGRTPFSAVASTFFKKNRYYNHLKPLDDSDDENDCDDSKCEYECLPQNEIVDRSKAREASLVKRKEVYVYGSRLPDTIAKIDNKYHRSGENLNDWKLPLPPFVEHSIVLKLPPSERFTFEETLVFATAYNYIPINNAFSKIDDFFRKVGQSTINFLSFGKRKEELIDKKAEWAQKSIGEKLEYLYDLNIFDLFSRPKPIRYQWIYDDDEFARQRLGGINSMVIEKCNKLPEELKFNSENDGEGLKEILLNHISKNQLFVADYRTDLGYMKSPRNDRFMEIPIAFFHIETNSVNGEKTLMPTCIQLRVPDGLWFRPTDSNPLAWLVAKFFVQNADAHHHQFTCHLGRAHTYVEPFIMSIQRNLSKFHPLYVLVAPHHRATLMINDEARYGMLANDGMIEKSCSSGRIGAIEILSGSYQTFNGLIPLPDLFKSKGVDAESFPVSYPYRDDALLVHECIHSFVSQIINIYYKTDHDVAHDRELTAMGKEIQEKSPLGTSYVGFTPPKTIPDLITMFTNLIVIQTLQHSILNYGQFDFYSFIPNMPFLFHLPLPDHKQDIDEFYIFKTLPDVGVSLGQIAMAHLLSLPPKDHTLIKANPIHAYRFKHPQARRALERYRELLFKLRNDLSINSQTRINKYLETHPEQIHYVPKSVEYPYCDPKHGLSISIQI